MKMKECGITDIAYDLGWNGKNLTGLLEYDCLLNKHTWELPIIKPTRAQRSHSVPGAIVEIEQKEVNGVLSIQLHITNKTDAVAYINTITISPVQAYVPGIKFRFPANVPHGTCEIDLLEQGHPVQAGLANFCVAFNSERGAMNMLFIGTEEKWGTGVWRQGDEVHTAFSAAVEANLAPNETLTLGTLYIQPCENPETQLKQAHDFVEKLGFLPPSDGMGYSGVMYSCHPFGTMDAGFASLKEDLFQYAKRLPALKAMGIRHVWILPVFDHNEKGVYHSNDQDIIDQRYGGEEACVHFCNEAKKLGLTVLFDYVPHGPVPEHPLAANNPDWCSKRRNGSMHIEWDCVSMDYNHPGYLDYTRELVAGHVRRFGISGARIDCAMGGLSNWKPRPGKRPSSSSICAGVKISKAIRDGFLQENVVPLNMPENFHPIPIYYPYTDVFYGFNLYRVLCELEHYFHENPAKYVDELIQWLRDEAALMPAGMGKLRFLGNHDTVSWVWQARRPTAIYGVEGAKALWALFCLIDGMPMIYQGDEDPTQYSNSEAPNLTEFFTQLFAQREELSGETTYLPPANGVAAFTRGDALVLVNLSPAEAAYTCANTTHTLAPYEYRIVKG